MKNVLRFAAISLVLFSACASLRATVYDWKVGTGSADIVNWNDKKNWVPAQVPVSGDTAQFGANGTNNVDIKVTDAAVQNIIFLAGGQAFTIQSTTGNALHIGAGGTGSIVNNNTLTETINVNPVVLDSSSTFNAAAGNLDFGGAISLGAN